MLESRRNSIGSLNGVLPEKLSVMEQVEKSRTIPSLDGLRALSVFAVILGHLKYKWLDRIPLNVSFRNGNQGVAVFFGISGLLITHVLLKDLRRNGNISLKRFYLRLPCASSRRFTFTCW